MTRQRSRSAGVQLLVDSWISTLTRVFGIVGLGYETFVDKLKNPTALLVFGALATAKDVLQYRQIIKEGSFDRQRDEDDERHQREMS